MLSVLVGPTGGRNDGYILPGLVCRFRSAMPTAAAAQHKHGSSLRIFSSSHFHRSRYLSFLKLEE